MRKSVEITIVGDLHYRQIIVTGGGEERMRNGKFEPCRNRDNEEQSLDLGI